MVSPDYFLFGIVFFAHAQGLYIRAFGLRPFGPGPMAASFAIVGVAAYLYVSEGLGESEGRIMLGFCLVIVGFSLVIVGFSLVIEGFPLSLSGFP